MNITIDLTEEEVHAILTKAGLFLHEGHWQPVPAWLKKRPMIIVPMKKRSASA